MLTKQLDDERFRSWMAEAGQRRRFERWILNVPASLTAAGVRHRGTIWDVSPLGALVRLSAPSGLSVGAYVTLTPRGYHAVPGEVRHTQNGGRFVGVMLLHGPEELAEITKWLDAQKTQNRN